jgi:hypothetical protein
MGSAAKIILTGAASLIVGIFSFGLYRAQVKDLEAAALIGKVSQLERVRDHAFRVSVFRVQANVKSYRDAGNMSALNIAASRTNMGPGPNSGVGTYSYNLYVPYAGYHATGTVTVNLPGEGSKTYNVEVKRVNGTGSTGTGTKPGYRSFVRGQWQMTAFK